MTEEEEENKLASPLKKLRQLREYDEAEEIFGRVMDMSEPCANCGWPLGKHRANSNQCPVSEHHVEWRETTFAPKQEEPEED